MLAGRSFPTTILLWHYHETEQTSLRHCDHRDNDVATQVLGKDTKFFLTRYFSMMLDDLALGKKISSTSLKFSQI